MNDNRNSPYRPAKAVALNYRDKRPELPRITATGKGALAEKIVAIALAHGVKVREDADLTEILGAIEVDSPIPIEAFTAVAEILAYVYRANTSTPPEALVP
jgi:flagellar biosynthesis protein